MQIKFASIMVKDQNAALLFYTKMLGFTKKADIPMGKYRWLTVESSEGIAGVELVLESMAFAPAHGRGPSSSPPSTSRQKWPA
jgi:predicted enzyme related to lactoylglutathione lyase